MLVEQDDVAFKGALIAVRLLPNNRVRPQLAARDWPLVELYPLHHHRYIGILVLLRQERRDTLQEGVHERRMYLVAGHIVSHPFWDRNVRHHLTRTPPDVRDALKKWTMLDAASTQALIVFRSLHRQYPLALDLPRQ